MNIQRRMLRSDRYYYDDDDYFTDNKAVHSDQSLIDEVRYLHSLWRQGPPAKPPPSERRLPQNYDNKRKRFEPGTKPTEATEKKKIGKQKKQRKEAKISKVQAGEKEGGVSGKEEPKLLGDKQSDDKWNGEWNAGGQVSEAEWNSTPRKIVETKPLSEEEELQFGQIKLQQKVLRSVKEFFSRGEDADSTEEEDEDDEEDEGDDGDGNEGDVAEAAAGGHRLTGKELEASNFFLKLFEEEKELAKFYEQNCNCGAFECLVCAGVGAKIGKRFPDCVSLIQHSMKILKTKKKAAHRGYGSAICRLLGWNSERLPSIVKPNELKPRGCIPPPDEVEAQDQEEGVAIGQEADPIGGTAVSKKTCVDNEGNADEANVENEGNTDEANTDEEDDADEEGDADEASADDEGDADEASADDEDDVDDDTKSVEDEGQVSR